MDLKSLTQLPISRIRTVMKTSPAIGPITPEALFMMCRAAELFIEFMSKNAHPKGSKHLNYHHLASYVESEEALEFLVQILPKKITVKEYKKILEEKNSRGGDSEDDSSEDESDAEGSGDSDSSSSSGSDDDEAEENGSVISIDSSSSDEKENSKNMSNKKSPIKHKTGDSP